MKIKGIKTSTDSIVVEISPWEMVDTLLEELHEMIAPKKPKGMDDSLYINQDGYWEGWSKGRGVSGDYNTYQVATDVEKTWFRGLEEFKIIARDILLNGEKRVVSENE